MMLKEKMMHKIKETRLNKSRTLNWVWIKLIRDRIHSGSWIQTECCKSYQMVCLIRRRNSSPRWPIIDGIKYSRSLLIWRIKDRLTSKCSLTSNTPTGSKIWKEHRIVTLLKIPNSSVSTRVYARSSWSPCNFITRYELTLLHFSLR